MANTDRLIAVLAAGAFLAAGPQTKAATVSALSVAFADVEAAVSAAVDGDIVMIPPGTAKWTGDSKLNISGKAITLQGAGVGRTIIQDAVQGQLISWDLSPGASRMTGIEFQNPTRTVADGIVTNGSARVTSATANFTSADLYTGISGVGIPANTYIGVVNSSTSVGLSSSYTANVPVKATASGTLVSISLGGRLNLLNGLISVVGSNTNGSSFRWDNCKWSYVNGNPSFDTVIGVIDHLEVWWNNGPWLFNYDNLWDGKTWGDGSWTAASNFGSSQFLFLEDITAHNTRSVDAGLFDNYGGSRIVVRHSQLYSATIQSHGTESTGRRRGVRAVEVYNNTFTRTNTIGNILGDLRSGVMLFHDNQTVNYPVGTYLFCQNHRNLYSYTPWGRGADGTSQWDVNEPGGPFWTGTAASYSGLVVTVNGAPGWTTNQWAGYSVKRTTNLGNLTGPDFCIINSSGSNTLTYQSQGGNSGGDLKFTAGDSIEIWKVNQALDQPGRSGGSLITGQPTPILPSGWNDQVTEPIRCWNNTRTENGAAINMQPGNPMMRAGEHYINGVALPGYTPYTYPHPLVSGLLPSPANLRIVPGS